MPSSAESFAFKVELKVIWLEIFVLPVLYILLSVSFSHLYV